MKYFRVEVPLRIDFCGGFTDVQDIHEIIGTAIANQAVDLYCDYYRKNKVSFYIKGFYDACKNKEKRVMAIHLKLIKYMSTGLDYSKFLKLKIGLSHSTGLGTSSAFAVLLIIGAELCNKSTTVISLNNIVDKAYNFETKIMNVIGGYQDYVAAIWGGYNFINTSFMKFKQSQKKRYILKGYLEQYINNYTFIILTKRQFSSTDIILDIIKRCKNGDKQAIRNLNKIKEYNIDFNKLVSNNIIKKDSFNFLRMMKIINGSWLAQKRLSPLINNELFNKIENLCSKYIYALHGVGAGNGALVIYANERSVEKLNTAIHIFAQKNSLKCLYPKVNNIGLSYVVK
jgi:galactokinase/mevalonate kinase-like predicted kinase